MTLGQKIREARVEKGLTQKQLVGDYITRNMLSKIENDSATPSVRTLEYLAKALGFPVGYFLEDSELSDGSSPDGLDNMRDAYRAGKWEKCVELLQASTTAGTTDEGYLLHARAGSNAAREALARGDLEAAVGFAEMADYYNKEGIYYSHRIDAEMSLILAEASLWQEGDEFESNIAQFEKAALVLDYYDRYLLDKAEYLLAGGNTADAGALLESSGRLDGVLKGRFLYLTGRLTMERCEYAEAAALLEEAAGLSEGRRLYLVPIYRELETCYRELEDYKKAYDYASKQLR